MLSSLIVLALVGHAIAAPLNDSPKVEVQVKSKCYDDLCNRLDVIIQLGPDNGELKATPEPMILELEKFQVDLKQSLEIKPGNCSYYTSAGDNHPVLARCQSLTEESEYEGLFALDGKWFSIMYDAKVSSHVLSKIDDPLRDTKTVDIVMKPEERIATGAEKEDVVKPESTEGPKSETELPDQASKSTKADSKTHGSVVNELPKTEEPCCPTKAPPTTSWWNTFIYGLLFVVLPLMCLICAICVCTNYCS